MIEMCDKRKSIIDSTRHVIVLGGPGSGKTTVALLKANKEVSNLLEGQKILFLGFARATVRRVLEASKENINKENFAYIEMSTYHSFFLKILESYGYLLNKNYPFKVLGASDMAVKVAKICEKQQQRLEYERIFKESGELVFDLYASKTIELISRSEKIRKLISNVFPIIIVDEFQDTNNEQWEVIKLIGEKSRVIALADPQQRIYDFIGADKKRIEHFKEHFAHSSFDFGDENYRSYNTDINDFGNDILLGKTRKKTYKDLKLNLYKNEVCLDFCFHKNSCNSMCHLFDEVLNGVKSLENTSDWSIVILFPSKEQVLQASKYLFHEKSELNGFTRDVVVELERVELSGFLFAKLLEKFSSTGDIKNGITSSLIKYLRGRRGVKIWSGALELSRDDLNLADRLESYMTSNNVEDIHTAKIIEEIKNISERTAQRKLTGNPSHDWKNNLSLFEKLESKILSDVRDDVGRIRLLDKGSKLAKRLSSVWHKHGYYHSASKLFRKVVVEEGLLNDRRKPSQINIMNIHKAKGKEFDEVFLFEGDRPGKRFVYKNSPTDEERRTMKVAVTRAKKRVTILSPAKNKCPLLDF